MMSVHRARPEWSCEAGASPPFVATRKRRPRNRFDAPFDFLIVDGDAPIKIFQTSLLLLSPLAIPRTAEKVSGLRFSATGSNARPLPNSARAGGLGGMTLFDTNSSICVVASI